MRSIEDARAACAARRWGDARRIFADLPADGLDVDDLDLAATAGYLTGDDETGFATWARAYELCVADGTAHRAALFGMKIAQGLGFKGDIGRCHGWVDRTGRLLQEASIDCVEQGYLDNALAMGCFYRAGDIPGALAHFEQAGKIGARFAHRELIALARIGEGRMRIYLGDLGEGMALLDEAMVSVEAGELSVLSTGEAYCTVIDACAELLDLARCRTWTESMVRWCDTQQELVIYQGHCFLHRAEVLGLLGAWPEALTEVRRACDRLAEPENPAALAGASAIEGDLLRQLGELDAADDAFRRASELGRDPQPGLALLRLAQGRVDAADAMIRRALAEATSPTERARLIGAVVEVALAAGEVEAAREAAEELRATAAELGTQLVRAQAAHAMGAALLVSGDAAAGLAELRRAFDGYLDLGARPGAARVRLLIAGACDALGDEDSAATQRQVAADELRSMAAPPAAAENVAEAPDGLTQRELEVLRLLARGHTNRMVATELFISEKTVASHAGHIFTKLGVTSRSAATAYAYDHGLV